MNCIESESHVILYCELYDDLRSLLFEGSRNICFNYGFNFDFLDDSIKLTVILAHKDMVKYSAKFCNNVLMRRRSFFI